MSKLTKKKFISKDISELVNLSNPELREILRGARQLFNAQEKIFEKRKKSVYSFALDKMQKYYEDSGKKSVSRMKRSDMQKEIGRLHDFFNSETSTLPGTYKAMREQDIRIFGADEKGRPTRRMTLEQRTDFWSAYNEFISLEKESYVRNMGSNTIQQFLGQMIIDRKKREDDFQFGMGDFNHLKMLLEENKKREEWEMNGYGEFNTDVLSGKRPY